MPDDIRSVNRHSQRKRVQMSVTLVIEGDEAERRATAVDLSHYGLRLQSDSTLAPGQSVGLVLPNNPDCLIKARVVWVGNSDSVLGGQAGFEFLNVPARPAC
jgi:hypothetical protein